MQTRRHFIGNVATGLAGSLATGKVLGANDRIRVGVVGVGDRGTQLAREAAACPNTELTAFADVYTRRLSDALKLAPEARTYTDYRQMLDAAPLDAVLIATPQHSHAECFIAAMAAGKHVYQEKAMAFTIDQAKAMRAAYQRAGNRVVQIGHQTCSMGHVADAANYLASGAVGQVTAIRASMYRNTPHGKPQWTRPVYPDMTSETVDWRGFLSSAPARDFDPDRFINWRLFSDYSGGNVHESMSQQIAFWYKVMGLEIPLAVTMTGGLYRWVDGREVPDTMNVVMEHDTLLFSWDSGFGNNQRGIVEDVLGTDGTIVRGQQIRYMPQKVNRPDGVEMLGETNTAPRAHMQNFLDAIRLGKPVNCPFETGYRVSIACAMAIESFYAGRRVQWDPAKEEIV
ncbi:MAG TPA: Gfo/Idh/MocA family oxidoreductase [Bryobacteraceae bacterium]|jgi:predicted dehydrogenase|nr:Gfo/Idh/MocA family oxidoreductase [Bryobacteraceae bacterium]